MLPMDDPRHMPQDSFVAFSWNDVRWPSAHRRVTYLSDKRLDAMKGYALFTMACEDANSFATRDECEAFVEAHEEKRGHRYGDLRIDTFANLRAMTGLMDSEGVTSTMEARRRLRARETGSL